MINLGRDIRIALLALLLAAPAAAQSDIVVPPGFADLVAPDSIKAERPGPTERDKAEPDSTDAPPRPQTDASTTDIVEPAGTGHIVPDAAPAATSASPSAKSASAALKDSRPLRRGNQPGKVAAAPGDAHPRTASTWKSWASTGTALAAVIAAIVLLAWGYRNIAGGRVLLRPRRQGLFEVLSRASLSPKQSLALVRIGPRAVLIAYSGDRTTALDVIDDADLVARLAGQSAATRSPAAEFQASLAGQERAYSVADEPLPETRVRKSVPARPVAGDEDLEAAKRRLAKVLDGIRATTRSA